jgi:TusA-related sulfurtransferase
MEVATGGEMKAVYTLDFRGSITPIMLLKMSQMFSAMDVEDILEIEGSDPDTQKDLFKVLPTAAYELISVDTTDKNGPERFYRIRLKKRAKE